MLNSKGYHKTELCRLMLNGKYTKEQIAKRLVKEFKMKIGTARRTVAWTCSMVKKETGKPANFKRGKLNI